MQRSTIIGITAAITAIGLALTLLTPARVEAHPPKHLAGQCPSWSVHGVFADPDGDWDHDGRSNNDELYGGTNPCIHDGPCPTTSTTCTTPTPTPTPTPTAQPTYGCGSNGHWTWTGVNHDPNSDWDHDEVSNLTEAQAGANPCVHPCPHPKNVDFRLNPNGVWDNDGKSNREEQLDGTNPCNSRSYNPCPNWQHYQLKFMPHADWDGDGSLNSTEVKFGSNPCSKHSSSRLPHISGPIVIPSPAPIVNPALPPTAICPAGYRYYHPGTGLCYANPIRTARPPAPYIFYY